MKNITPMFPGFHLQTLRRKPRSLLKPEQTGVMSRRRVFSKENTFWAFFSQVLDADGGCKEVIRKLQAYASIKGVKMPSSSTASYCTARKKLDEDMLCEILEHTVDQLEEESASGLLNNRRVVVVDGTGVSMPDTRENQEVGPQSSILKAGCSFPVAHICACFSLQSGGLLSYEIGNKKDHELPMLRKQWETFEEGDILLGDKLFCNIDTLKRRKVDSVVTLSKRLPFTAASCKRKLGENDLFAIRGTAYLSSNSTNEKPRTVTSPYQIILRPKFFLKDTLSQFFHQNQKERYSRIVKKKMEISPQNIILISILLNSFDTNQT